MRVDIFGAPPPLKIGEGEKSFQLLVKRFTGAERSRVTDAALSMSVERLHDAICPLVIGWENVCGPDGQPIGFEGMDAAGRPERRINAFLGAVDLETQMAVFAAIMAFVGIPTGDIDAITTAIRGAKQDLRPTSTPDAATPASASGSSSS